MDIENESLSVNGKRNAFVHTCRVVGQRKHYASCAYLVDRYDENGILAEKDATCERAMNNRSCPALSMRHEEVDKCKPIYFVERTGLVELAITSASRWIDDTVYKKPAYRGMGMGEGKNRETSRRTSVYESGYDYHEAPTPRPKRPQSNDPIIPDIDYASVITKAVAERRALSGEPTTVAPASTAIKALPGESPLQALLRIRKEG